jgi:hypothetical protein
VADGFSGEYAREPDYGAASAERNRTIGRTDVRVSIAANRQPETVDWPPMADEARPAPKVQLQTPQMELDRQLLRDEDLLNEEHLRRMDQVLLRRNLDHARMFSRKLSLELQNFVHLYTPEANELRRRIEKYMVMERLIEKEMARRHTY